MNKKLYNSFPGVVLLGIFGDHHFLVTSIYVIVTCVLKLILLNIKTYHANFNQSSMIMSLFLKCPCSTKEETEYGFSLSMHPAILSSCFNYKTVDMLSVTCNNICVRDVTYFTHPQHDWQRRYEALRTSFIDCLPDKVVADRFGFSHAYFRLLKHQFRHGKIDFSEPVPEGKTVRCQVTVAVRYKIKTWREQHLSAGEITELLSEDGIDISVRTVERVLAEEGFKKLPRRTRQKTGITVKGAEIPEQSERIVVENLNGQRFDSAGAGIFLFAPFLTQLKLDKIVQAAKLPGSRIIPAQNYLLSFLALKLLGTERYSHVGDHAFDPGLGLFAGLNILPKSTALSTYSHSLDEGHISHLQAAFVEQAAKLGLYNGNIINLDFYTAPHYGDESVIEKHWTGARGKVMKGALCLFAQDAESKLMLYAGTDIQRAEADDQVLSFLSFWQGVKRGPEPILVFDSRFTSYGNLSALNSQKISFITLRRRGQKQIENANKLTGWKRIHIPHDKRKFPNPQVHESYIDLRGYTGKLRQIIVRGNGHEKPAFLVTNDFAAPVELVVSNYARRWRVENGIAEAVKFFHLNALSSPILVKIHFDVALTMVADTLYTMLANKLRGFEDCDAPKLYRYFIKGKGIINVQNGVINVTYPKRAHNPVLRGVPWQNLPLQIPWLNGVPLKLVFK
jgi:transposase